MFNDQIVYWSNVVSNKTQHYLTLHWEEPIPLSKHLYKTFKDVANQQDKNFFRCPSITEEIKNTFVLMSPIDLTITSRDNSISIEEYNQEFFDGMVEAHRCKSTDNPSTIVSVALHTILLADEKCNVSITPPYMSNTEFSRSMTMLAGQLDISSWVRPLDVVFFVKDNVPVHIRKGEPLLYFKFYTDKKIIFKRFTFTKEIDELVQVCTSARRFMNVSIISKLYDLFNKSDTRKRLFKLIKKEVS